MAPAQHLPWTLRQVARLCHQRRQTPQTTKHTKRQHHLNPQSSITLIPHDNPPPLLGDTAVHITVRIQPPNYHRQHDQQHPDHPHPPHRRRNPEHWIPHRQLRPRPRPNHSAHRQLRSRSICLIRTNRSSSSGSKSNSCKSSHRTVRTESVPPIPSTHHNQFPQPKEETHPTRTMPPPYPPLHPPLAHHAHARLSQLAVNSPPKPKKQNLTQMQMTPMINAFFLSHAHNVTTP